jgi:pimeloyl-ACP methyl ester carboxylesterase
MLTDYTDYVKAGFRDEAAFTSALCEGAVDSFKELWDFSREMTARLTWKPYMFNRRLPPLLGEVQTPTLLIWGGEDNVVPLVCGEQYVRAMPHARLETVASAGHFVELEEPEAVADLIVRHAAG